MKPAPLPVGLCGLLLAIAFGQAAENEPRMDLALAPGQLEIKPSFETCSYYFRPTGRSETTYAVEFRRAGDAQWRAGFEAVCDQPVNIWKGSLFGLAEDAAWQLRIVAGAGGPAVAEGEFRTWSSHPRIAKTVDLSKLDPENKGGIVISDQGSPEGWIKYTAPKGWVVRRSYDPNDANAAAITFQHARYVMLDGVVINGGMRYGVMVDQSDAVRISNCEISGWGRVGVQQFTNTGNRGKYFDAKGEVINLDGGVEINRSWGTVVERCYIHDPRGRANSWMFQHPSGPCGIHVGYARGGTVIRWNDIIGSDEHRWNDVIETTSNSSAVGGFYRDSDIVGNYLAFGNDDGVELEGGGMNVRFYRNEVEGTTCGVSTGACLLGPQFVIGNLVTNPGDESGLSLMLFKNSHGVVQGGKRYFVNNTLYGLDDAAYGSYGKPLPGAHIGFMRNNVFICNGSRAPGESGRLDNFDHDLFWAKNNGASSARFLSAFQQVGQEAHGLAADPALMNPRQGDYHLTPNSAARGQAAIVTNINDAGGDLGAFFQGATEVPGRPLALRAETRQVNFDDPAQSARGEVTLTLPPSETHAVKFVIRQNLVFKWFKVEPAAGEIRPGESLKLVVTVEPSRLQGRPLFKGAFIVRTPEGLSRPISVYAKGDFQEDPRPAAAPHTAYIDAARSAGADQAVKPTDAPGVVGGKYVALAGGSGGAGVTAAFDITAKGNYALLGRVGIYDDLMERRGFELSLDKEKPAAFTMIDDYQWNVSDRRFRVVFLYALGELAAGRHELQLKSVKGDIKVNELIVTDKPEVFFVQHWQRERTE